MSKLLYGWKDLRMSVAGSATGVGTPTLAPFGPTGNIKQMSFGVGDSVYLGAHVDHDAWVGSDCHFHVHWSTNGTNIQPVKWQLNWIQATGHNTDNFGAESVLELQEAAQGSLWRHMVTEDPVGQPLPDVDSLILCELKRVTNGGTENSDTVFGLFVDIHYQVQQFATPYRSPDFNYQP